ncbi:MAG: hypothetical protein DRG87_10845 [Deltaproteobacteria bacterium]|nr:hypothetical protein [Deltaproteobacteria bacterium]RLB27709.1 MAG: hypothetical protein DRG87_10845 [Deltaproteobacteria bacterium]
MPRLGASIASVLTPLGSEGLCRRRSVDASLGLPTTIDVTMPTMCVLKTGDSGTISSESAKRHWKRINQLNRNSEEYLKAVGRLKDKMEEVVEKIKALESGK